MKKLLPIVLLFLATLGATAQESIIGEINYSDLGKYISLAKQNYPKRKIIELQKEVAKTEIPTAQVSYFDIFNASYFYRPSERTVVVDPINPYTVNGLQLGITVSLGTLLAKPFAVKRAKAQYKIAELQVQDYDKELETLVKTRYYDYILSLGQLKIATQNAQESKGVAESLRKKFEKSEITLDAYNQSRLGQTTAATTQIEVEVAFLKAKDALEEVIGSKLSEVK